jgi:hypothetical protein
VRQKVWHFTYVCDSCGYVISRNFEDVLDNHIVLNLEGEEFHFHAKGHGHSDQDCLDYFQNSPLVKKTLLAERKRWPSEVQDV